MSSMLLSLPLRRPSWPTAIATRSGCAGTRWRRSTSSHRHFFAPLCASPAHSHSGLVGLSGSHYLKSLAVKRTVRDQQILTSGDGLRFHSDAILRLPFPDVAAPARQFGISSIYFRHSSNSFGLGQSSGTDKEIHQPPCPISFPLFSFLLSPLARTLRAQIVHLTSWPSFEVYKGNLLSTTC